MHPSPSAAGDPEIPPGFERVARARPPHYEVWYGKVDLGPGRAFWFRYTITDGSTRESATWAILFDHGRVVTGKAIGRLEDLAPSAIFDAGDSRLEIARAVGRAGPITWDLAWRDSGRRFAYVPGLARRLGLAKTSYDASFLDLRISGRIVCGDASLGPSLASAPFQEGFAPLASPPDAASCRPDRGGSPSRTPPSRSARPVAPAIPGLGSSPWGLRPPGLPPDAASCRPGGVIAVDSATGMVGHIEGSRSAHSWAWAHANRFDGGEDAVFEGLSARVPLAGRPSRPLSTFVLFLAERRYVFRSIRTLLAARSVFGPGHWEFEARSGTARLVGHAAAPGPVALVEYTDTDGSKLWCANSKLANLTLRIVDRRNGLDERLLATGTAAFEIVGRERPSRPIDL